MKVYYDTISKRFISFSDCLNDLNNRLLRGEKRKYDVLVLDDTSEFYLEKTKQNKIAKQISFFDNKESI